MKLIYGAVLSLIIIGVGGYFIYQSSVPPISQSPEEPTPQLSSTDTGKEAAKLSSIATENNSGNTAAGKTTAQQQEIAALKGQVAALSEQMILLRREISALQRQQATGVAVNGQVESSEVASTDPDAKTAEEKEQQEEHKKRTQTIEANFQQEQADPNWSTETTAVLQRTFAANESLQTAVQNLECRNTTCRVELNDDDKSKLAKSIPLLLNQLAETLPNAIADQVEDNNGNKRIVLYLSREQNQ